MVISEKDKARVLEAIKAGKIDAADVSFPNLIDAIVLEMKKSGNLELLESSFEDKRRDNQTIPFYLILTPAITAKMKTKTSLTDMPFAITEAETLSEIGWNIWDNERGLEKGLMSEGTVRNLVKKYTVEELIAGYNNYIQKQLFPSLGIAPDIHIPDCTEIEVELCNSNYEGSAVLKDNEGTRRGYKLSTIRGIYGDTGILEEICFGTIKEHDLELSREMILKSTVLKPGDILINDRGFLSRDVINHLKLQRGVDTYIPLRKNMEAFEQAVSIAKEENDWQKHPNRKRKNQKITFVDSLGCHWKSSDPENDVRINACVVHDEKEDKYYVFVTTDTEKTCKEIITTYELRPEIEEDYRQIKDFWQIEDFKSTKLNFVVFHIVMVLIGYLFFQLYKEMEAGSKYAGKCLPVAVKNYIADGPKSVIIYSGQYFGIFGFLEFVQLYALCSAVVKKRLNPILAKV
ncbi:MAG: hypothetical protein DDT31_01884 [Syntrophomonadaceae bacterium]|nr:hypothetical protein [Bacillota bacterium]